MKLQQWFVALALCAVALSARAESADLDAGASDPSQDAAPAPAAAATTTQADASPAREAEQPAALDAGVPAPAAPSADTAAAAAANVAPAAPLSPAAAASAPAPQATKEAYGARAQAERPAGPGEFEPYGTGSRLGIPLRELPATVTLVDRKTLAERGVVDLTQALGLMAGVMPTWQYGGFLHVRVRGFQAMTLVDGRRDPRALLADSAPQAGLYDIERVELLRGPSSSLYGYGAVGGVVNLIRRRASRNAAYELDLGLGLPLQFRAHVGAQGPIGPMFSYRVDVGHVTHENFRGARTERSQLSSSLRFAPNRRHTLNVRLSYSFDRYNTDVGIPAVEDPDHAGRWILPPHAPKAAYYGTRSDHLHYQRLEIAADYRAELTKTTYLEARAAVAQDHYDYLAAEELNYVPPADGNAAQVERASLYFARGWLPMLGQLELHSTLHTGPLTHRWLVGYQIDSFGGLSDRGNTGGIEPAPVDFAYPVDRTPRIGRLRRTAIDHYRQLTHGLYAFDHIKLLEGLFVTGGVRFDAYRSFTRREFVDQETGQEIVDPSTGMYRPRNEQRNQAVTGQAGVVYSPLSALTLYASYASSFMPKIVYPSEVQPKQYDPERGQQFEGGVRLHGNLREHRVALDVAGYYIAKKDIVIPRGVDDYAQAGKAISRGLDLSVQYVAPAWVQLDAAYSLTAAEFVNFVSADPVSGDNVSRKGNQLDFTPRHSGNVWLRILPTRRIGLGVGSRFMGEQFADVENRLPLPSYALLDASVWFGNDHATFTLSANNLLDEHQYFSSAINTWATNPQVTPGPGREILGTLRLTM